MCVCVCVCVCTYVCVCACVYIYVHTCVSVLLPSLPLQHAWAYELPSDTKRICLDFIPLVLKHKVMSGPWAKDGVLKCIVSESLIQAM